MRHTSSVILSGLLLLFLTEGCIDAPSFDKVPLISNPRLELGTNPVDPSNPESFVDLLFDFADGDGDIGRARGDTTTENLFLENTQLNEPFIESSFSIPFIPANGGVPDITGTIRVQLSLSTFQGFCLANPSLTQVEYTLWIKDRAGNRSNSLVLPAIPLECN